MNGARAGGDLAGPIGATVGAAGQCGTGNPECLITSVRGQRVPSVVVPKQVLIGEPLGVPMREQTLRGGQLRGLGNAFGLAETAKSRRVMDVFEIVSVQRLR